MNIIANMVTALQERNRLTGELQSALAKKSKGSPGWDTTIAKLRSQLFGDGSSPRKGIHGNPQKPFVPYTSGPLGSFDFATDQQDRKRVQQGGLNNIILQTIPVLVTGPVLGYNPFLCDANGLQVLTRTMDDNGNVTESSDTARVFIRINSPHAPWIPLGFGFSAQGVSKSDNLVYQGYIERFWLYVQIPTTDSLQPSLVIALLRSVAMFGPGGGSNLYSSPGGGGLLAEQSGTTPGQGGGGPGSSGGGGGQTEPGIGGSCFTGEVKIWQPDRVTPILEIKEGSFVLTSHGSLQKVKRVLVHNSQTRRMFWIDNGFGSGYITDDHLVRNEYGLWVAAKEHKNFARVSWINCPVYNLEVDTDEPESKKFDAFTKRSFMLENGVFAHNAKNKGGS